MHSFYSCLFCLLNYQTSAGSRVFFPWSSLAISKATNFGAFTQMTIDFHVQMFEVDTASDISVLTIAKRKNIDI